jgi:hypothetical protein
MKGFWQLGIEMNFTSLDYPVLRTVAVSNITPITADLRGTVNANTNNFENKCFISGTVIGIYINTISENPFTTNGNIVVYITTFLSSHTIITTYYYKLIGMIGNAAHLGI